MTIEQIVENLRKIQEEVASLEVGKDSEKAQLDADDCITAAITYLKDIKQ